MNNYYKFRRAFFDPLAWYLSKRELYDLMQGASTKVGDIVFYSERYVGRGYYASLRSVQVPEEIRALGEIVQQAKPLTIIEIGTYKGGTLFLWCRSNPQAELFISVDLPGGQYGGGYEIARERMYREFIYDRPHAKMELMRVNSHHASTISSLRPYIRERNVDFLYIDGDHTYEGVKQDFNMYAPFVKNGLIAFHDIVTTSQGCGVYQLWEELKMDYPTYEIIERGSNKGIGVVFIGEAEKIMPSIRNL